MLFTTFAGVFNIALTTQHTGCYRVCGCWEQTHGTWNG